MSARPTSGPVWPTNRRKRRQQHSRTLRHGSQDATSGDLTVIARDLYRAGKIPATALDFIATNRTRGQRQ